MLDMTAADEAAQEVRSEALFTGDVVWAMVDALTHEITRGGRTHNLITDVGDQFYGERAAGIASPPGQVTGMKLGTSNAAVTKSGAGAALGSYLSGSHQGIEAGFPTSSKPGSARRIIWQSTWAAGVATTASTIQEAVIVNNTLADATSTAANTIARTVFDPAIGTKLSTEYLVITWAHDLLGAA